MTGTDLSKIAIRRARKEARKRNLSIEFSQADVRQLRSAIREPVDMVISCDNAMPHLMTHDDLLQAAQQIHSCLVDNGVFLASIRDYDRLLADKPTATPVKHNDKRITFQIWDWYAVDEYQLHQYVIVLGQKRPRLLIGTARHKAYRRESITDVLNLAGFNQIQWLMPEETDYFQPIVVCRRSRSRA